MIIDRIENAGLYAGVSEEMAACLAYLKNCPKQPVSRFALTSAATAAVSGYTTVPEGKRQWEAHDRLIDIHYVAVGRERIRWANRELLEYTGKEPGGDVLRFEGSGTDFVLEEGMFCILFPDDAHMTKLAADEPEEIVKAILKIAL